MKLFYKRIIASVVAFVIVISVFSSIGFRVDAASQIAPITVRESAEIDLYGGGGEASDSEIVFAGCYGNQLKGPSKVMYDAFVDYYVKDKNTGVFSEPLYIGYAFSVNVFGNQILKDEMYNSMVKNIQEDFQGAINALLYDYPELYWFRRMEMTYKIQSTNSYSSSRVGCSVTDFKFYPIEIYSGASHNFLMFDSAVDVIFENLKSKIDNDIYQKDLLKLIHDYICETAYYSYSGAYVDFSVHSPEPIFMGDGGVVCEGYSKAFKILCDRFSIPCVLVSGKGSNGEVSEAHMWNYVQMDDAKWYLCDLTWDDQNDKIRYDYFIVDSSAKGMYETVGEEHLEDGDFAGNGLVNFRYPVLSNTKYMVCEHIWDSNYTTDKSATCEKNGSKSIHCKLCIATKNQKVISATGHSYATSKTAATLKTTGKKVIKCTKCDDVKSSATIYKPSKFTLSTINYTYNGKSQSPAVTIKDTKGNKLIKDRDYTIKYPKDQKTIGQHKIVITFKGDYSGSKNLYYNILPSATSKIKVSQTVTSLKATWSKVSGTTGYKVQLLNSKGTTLKTRYTKNLYYRFTGLDDGKTYKIKVTAYKTIDSKKVYSLKNKTVTTATKPAKPTLKVTASTKKAKLSWNRKSSSGYEIVYSVKSNFKSYKKVTVNGSANVKKTISGLKRANKYYFKIRAFKKVDGTKIYSAYSSVKSVKIK